MALRAYRDDRRERPAMRKIESIAFHYAGRAAK